MIKGYELVKLFSQSEDGKEYKLSAGDRINMRPYAFVKKGSKREEKIRRSLRGDIDPKKEAAKGAAAFGTLGGAATAIGAKLSDSTNKKAALLGLASGTAGAAGGALVGYVGSKRSKKLRERAENDPMFRYALERQEDLLNVKVGDMSKKDFVEKWGGSVKENGKSSRVRGKGSTRE